MSHTAPVDSGTSSFICMAWVAEDTKGDSPVREQQSLLALVYINKIAHRHSTDRIVFGGDFNLDINTAALAILERGFGNTADFRNLVREMGVRSTRTREYRKFGLPGESQYADYVFVTPNVTVHEFEVGTEVTASDHAPLRVCFS